MLAPQMCRCTNPHAESEAWFRVVHLGQFNHWGADVAYCREQTVEIALGHKGAFENGYGLPPFHFRSCATSSESCPHTFSACRRFRTSWRSS